MRLFCDLHIHSCLSPCGDELMTPNNIAGMAMLKGLDAIAVADHNSARNLPALSKTCAAMGVLLLPAMELTTAEEAHLLSYFPTVRWTFPKNCTDACRRSRTARTFSARSRCSTRTTSRWGARICCF